MSRGRANEGFQTGVRVPSPFTDPVAFRAYWKANPDARTAFVWPESLDYADLSGLDLSDCDLSNRSLYGTNLTHTAFWRTNLSGADLRGTIGLDATFVCGANIVGAQFDEDVQESIPTMISFETEDNVKKMIVKWYGDDGVVHRPYENGPAEIHYDAASRAVLEERYIENGAPVAYRDHPWSRTYSGDTGDDYTERYHWPSKTAEDGVATKTAIYRNRNLINARAEGDDLGLLRVEMKPSKLNANEMQAVEYYDSERYQQETGDPVFQRILSENGNVATYYTGWNELHREDGPVMRVIGADTMIPEYAWAANGQLYSDEESWRKALESGKSD